MTHINRWTARVLADAKAGVPFGAVEREATPPAPAAAHDTSREGAVAKQIRKALAKRVEGVAIEQFYNRARFDVTQEGLTIVAPSQFARDYMLDGSGREAQLAMHDVLGPDADQMGDREARMIVAQCPSSPRPEGRHDDFRSRYVLRIR